MNNWPQNPTLYEINAWAWLEQLSRRAGQPITLGNVPQAELERIAAYGFDGIWLMGVWQRSAGGRQVAREHVGLQGEYRQALPDYREADVVGSPYCIPEYRVDAALGGDAGLAQLRQQLADQGMRLMLDFVPNHLACDHAWLAEHPERLLQGGPAAWRASRSTTSMSRWMASGASLPMAAIPTWTAGPTRCRSIIASRPRAGPWPISCSPSPNAATERAVIWPCW